MGTGRDRAVLSGYYLFRNSWYPRVPTWKELSAVFDPQQHAADGSMPVEADFFDVGQETVL